MANHPPSAEPVGRAAIRIGPTLVLASALASTMGVVLAQLLYNYGDGLLAEILGGDAVLHNNRVVVTGAGDLAWAGGALLCLGLGLIALFAYPALRRHGALRLIYLWAALHVLRQALTQAIALPLGADNQLGLAYAALDAPPGLDVVIAGAGGVGLLLIALAAAGAFLRFTPSSELISTGRGRLTFALWIAVVPAAASVFLAIPFFLPDDESLVISGLPLTAVPFLATLAAAPGTTDVRGPGDERRAPRPWVLAATLVVVLALCLAVLGDGVPVAPTQWA